MKPKKFHHCVPFLPVSDLHETINYYKEELGFDHEWFWEATDAGIQRDHLRLLFCKSPEFVADINGNGHRLEICWFVENVDEIYREYMQKGVQIMSELEDKPWGIREFTIRDINGYHIRIGQGKE